MKSHLGSVSSGLQQRLLVKGSWGRKHLRKGDIGTRSLGLPEGRTLFLVLFCFLRDLKKKKKFMFRKAHNL